MSKLSADKSIMQAKISGYHHHSYELELKFRQAFLNGDREILKYGIDFLSTYVDVLAPQPFRAMKNTVICIVAIICRTVIEYGVDVEQSFLISDYYINEIENQNSGKELQILCDEMLNHYMDEIQKVQRGSYSLPVMRSLQYINQNLYKSIRVKEVAEVVRLNPTYLSTLFKSEVGVEMSRFIRKQKLEEAERLLLQSDYSVTEIAEMLGYCDLAYFSNQFKRKYGKSPKKVISQKRRDVKEGIS